MNGLRTVVLVLIAVILSWRPLQAQESAEDSRGIPVTDEAVVQKCSGCHQRDAAGRMTRISYLRKTPEGWQMSLRRMMGIYSVQLDTATAREIVTYLSDEHGIAPEELRPALSDVERNPTKETYEGIDDETRRTCGSCHTLGRVVTQRRTPQEWRLIAETHEGLYPWVDWERFERGGRDEDGAFRVDRVVKKLADLYPLRTAAWADWSSNKRPPRLAGTWVVSGGGSWEGPVYGTVEITGVADHPDQFRERVSYVRALTGQTVSREGKAVVYSGYQWRGRSGDGDQANREVLFVERGWRTMHGRWFRGAYDEIGTPVTLTRVEDAPIVGGLYPRGIRRGVQGEEVTLFGANLPGDVQAGDLDFGPDVRATRVVSRGSERLRVLVESQAGADPGERDVYLRGALQPAKAVVYDHVESIRVEPASGMARIGGVAFPKQYEHFRAVAYSNGPDGLQGTEDDVRIGPVKADWSLAEYPVTYDDDDVRFVGSIDGDGLFTPAADGPNPDRSRDRNNVGEVWAVATYHPAGDSGPPLRARSYLLVTVPLYARFDPWPGLEWKESGP